MGDKFKNTPIARNDPATGIFAVTPDDANDLPNPARYIRIGSTAGDVKVTSRAGDTVTIPNVQIGEVIVGDIMRIHATGTTATGITAWYDPEI